MTSRRYWRRHAAALPLITVAASCGPAVAEPAAVTQPPPQVVVRPAPAPSTAPVAVDFRLRGAAEQGAVMTGELPRGARDLIFDAKAIPVAADGSFLIAFDRDAGPNARLAATLADGRLAERLLSVAPATWRIEYVNTPFRGGAASDADLDRRRPAELAQIAAARAMHVESEGWKQPFRWPVSGRLSGFFGSQRFYQGKPANYHTGTDIAVPAGTPFVAPADGVVTLAASAPFTLEGNLLIVDHGMGLSSAFLHCQRIDVKLGDRVTQGQRLGTVGATGRARGAHMHWGLKWRDARIDPGKLAGPVGG